MAKSSLQIDLDDPRTAKIADVISNKTCKKILSALTEKELSEGDLAKQLGAPMNTIGYNIKKLEQAGLVEKSKEFFWSVKGKKIPLYKIVNKRIVISPKSLVRGVIPSLIVAGAISLGLGIWGLVSRSAKTASETMAETATAVDAGSVPEAAAETATLFAAAWFWFLAGALVALIVYLLWNYFVKRTYFKQD